MAFTDTIITLLVLFMIFYIIYTKLKNQGLDDTASEIKNIIIQE